MSALTSSLLAREIPVAMNGDTTSWRRNWASWTNAPRAIPTTYQMMNIKKSMRNVRHQRPSTSRRLRPIAAPSPMFSTNIAGVTTLRSVIPPLDCCRIDKKDAKATPKIAADGMARMTEIPANRTKCRRYMRNVSSSTSPISIGRMRSGAGTLKYSIPSVSYSDRLRVAGTKDWAMNQRAAPAPDDISVLFVEDDASVAQMYRLKLELDGYSVDVAADGLVALEKARATHPDIIFLDIRLPKMDGLEVLEALRAA